MSFDNTDNKLNLWKKILQLFVTDLTKFFSLLVEVHFGRVLSMKQEPFEIRQLRYSLEIADAGSFGREPRIRPRASQQIDSIEALLGPSESLKAAALMPNVFVGARLPVWVYTRSTRGHKSRPRVGLLRLNRLRTNSAVASFYQAG